MCFGVVCQHETSAALLQTFGIRGIYHAWFDMLQVEVGRLALLAPTDETAASWQASVQTADLVQLFKSTSNSQ